MEPLIPAASILVISTHIPDTSYALGDIVVIQKNCVNVAHRIIWKTFRNTQYHYLLKGDNNGYTDGNYTAANFLGRVDSIYHVRGIVDLRESKHRLFKLLFVVYSVINQLPIVMRISKKIQTTHMFWRAMHKLLYT